MAQRNLPRYRLSWRSLLRYRAVDEPWRYSRDSTIPLISGGFGTCVGRQQDITNYGFMGVLTLGLWERLHLIPVLVCLGSFHTWSNFKRDDSLARGSGYRKLLMKDFLVDCMKGVWSQIASYRIGMPKQLWWLSQLARGIWDGSGITIQLLECAGG